MTQAIPQAVTEAHNVAITVVREADNPFSNARPIYKMPQSSGPALRQPTSVWKAMNKYQEL